MTQTWMTEDLHRHGYGWLPYTLQVHTFQSSSAGWHRIALNCTLSCIWRWGGELCVGLCWTKLSRLLLNSNTSEQNAKPNALFLCQVNHANRKSIYQVSTCVEYMWDFYIPSSNNLILTGSPAGCHLAPNKSFQTAASWKPPNTVNLYVRERNLSERRGSTRGKRQFWVPVSLAALCPDEPVHIYPLAVFSWWPAVPFFIDPISLVSGYITSLTFIWLSCLTACLDSVRVLYAHVRICECITWHWPAK